MAGSPGKRLRDLQARLAAAGIDPETLERVPSPTAAAASDGDGEVRSLRPGATRARAGAHTRASEAEAPRAQVGQRTRDAVDARTADDVGELAKMLAPTLIARIERTRPTWAAGWLEDHPIDAEGMTDLLAYIRDEHGGSAYKLSLLTADSRTVLYVAKLLVAGPPRRRGRETTRARWDGEEEQQRSSLREAVTAPERASSGGSMSEIVSLVTAISTAMGNRGERDDRVLEAVREMTNSTRQQQTELLQTIVTTRAQDARGKDLLGQIQEIGKAKRALSSLREALVDDDEPRGRAPESERGLADKIGEQILSAAVQNEMSMRAQRQQQPPQQRIRRPLRSVPQSGGPQSS